MAINLSISCQLLLWDLQVAGLQLPIPKPVLGHLTFDLILQAKIWGRGSLPHNVHCQGIYLDLLAGFCTVQPLDCPQQLGLCSTLGRRWIPSNVKKVADRFCIAWIPNLCCTEPCTEQAAMDSKARAHTNNSVGHRATQAWSEWPCEAIFEAWHFTRIIR